MSDEIDRASDLQAAFEAFNLAELRAKVNRREIHPTGNCHWCGDKVDEALKLFCNPECSEDWHKYHPSLKGQS